VSTLSSSQIRWPSSGSAVSHKTPASGDGCSPIQRSLREPRSPSPRLRVSWSDAHRDAEHAEGWRTRRLLSMAGATLPNKTNLCENCYNPPYTGVPSPSALFATSDGYPDRGHDTLAPGIGRIAACRRDTHVLMPLWCRNTFQRTVRRNSFRSYHAPRFTLNRAADGRVC